MKCKTPSFECNAKTDKTYPHRQPRRNCRAGEPDLPPHGYRNRAGLLQGGQGLARRASRRSRRLHRAAARVEELSRSKLLVHAAAAFKADAIHPGYGVVSENPDFAALCAERYRIAQQSPRSSPTLMSV